MMRRDWIPPASPYGLIQEHLFPNEWMILVAAQFLNLTTRKQVEKILPTFMQRWREPAELKAESRSELVSLISPLGFGNRRADRLIKMTQQYSAQDWSHASELHGIGEYGARSWEIFCLGFLGDDEPSDGALSAYWKWAKLNQVKNGY